MPLFRGVAHVHTSYSRDGTLTLKDLKEKCLKEEINFVLIADHAEDLDANKYKALKRECDLLNGESFCLIPGLEFDCSDKIHILGFGITEYIENWDLGNITDKIQEAGGLSVLSHLSLIENMENLSKIRNLDFGECWNPSYATEFYPDKKSLEIYKKIYKKDAGVLAIAGADFHHTGYGHFNKKVFLDMHLEKLSREDILGKMKRGDFLSSNAAICMSPKEARIEGKFVIIALNRILSFIKIAARSALCETSRRTK